MRLLGVVVLHVLQFFDMSTPIRFQLFAASSASTFSRSNRARFARRARSLTLELVALRGENGEQVRIASRRRGDVLDDFRHLSRQTVSSVVTISAVSMYLRSAACCAPRATSASVVASSSRRATSDLCTISCFYREAIRTATRP